MWQSIKEPRGIISLSLAVARNKAHLRNGPLLLHPCCCLLLAGGINTKRVRGARGFTLRQTGHVGNTSAASFADGFTDDFFVASSAPSRQISLYSLFMKFVSPSRSATPSTRRNVRARVRTAESFVSSFFHPTQPRNWSYISCFRLMCF